MEFREDPWCLTLSEDMMDARDFKAEEAINLDLTVELPKSFSLGKRIWNTNYQNGWWSCTSNATSHGAQVLAVEEKEIIPTKDNIVTPDWKDLWKKMWHDLNDKNDSWDYVEKAVNVALKQGIAALEWGIVRFKWYCYGQWDMTMSSIEMMKRYLYFGCPIVWCLRGNSTTRTELSNGQLKTLIPAEKRTWGHAICLVGWDEWWLRFINSWKTNDGKWYKSRFYVTYKDMIKLGGTFNWRYRALYGVQHIKKDPEYIKRKNIYVAIIKGFKSTYMQESPEIQKEIEKISQLLRKSYPEINEEIPL